MNRRLFYKLYFLKNRILPNKVYAAEKKNIEERARFYSQFLATGDLVFDIGANMGNRVAAFVKLNARVVAVEPQPDCCLFLQERFGDKVTVVRKGVGDHQDTLDFYIADSNILSTFSKERIDQMKEGRFSEHSWQKTEKVEIVTLDDLIESYGLPKFVKIDVEGMELEVLKGLNSKVGSISFEYTVPEESDKLLACMQRLQTINKDAKFNYSPGETMKLELAQWADYTEMISIVQGREFINTSWGDIYIKNNPNS